MTVTARLKAYAKLNLGLRVLYKRPDSYHELRTVYQTISLADTLDVSFTRQRETRIAIDGTPHIEDNLVEKAARLLLDEMKITASVHFVLHKRIPSGAGLGGGSTDAAAVLLALPVLARKRVPTQRLFEIAGKLGSDVPFFLHGGTALGLGRGEELYPMPDRSGQHLLLVTPDIHSSTAEAYGDLSGRLTTIPLQNKLFDFQRDVWGTGREGSVTEATNDFEEVVFHRHPELQKIRNRLKRARATVAAMTGSGSAVFGVFESSELLNEARESFTGEKTFVLSFLSRARYRSAWRRALQHHIQAPEANRIKEDLWPPRSPYAR